MSSRGTHFAQSFRIPKCSCKMVKTLPYDIFPMSASSCTFHLRSFITHLWILWMFSGITASFGRPLRSASFVLAGTTTFQFSNPLLYHLSRWNRVRIMFIKPLFGFHCIFFFIKKQCFIKTRYSLFSIFFSITKVASHKML